MERNAPRWLKALVVFHLAAITIWALPNPLPDVMNGKVSPSGSTWILYYNGRYAKNFPPVQTYLFCLGFWQYWDMFSPNPSSTDAYGTARLTYQNGTVKDYEYPRVEKLSIPEKYVSERFRKVWERASDDRNPGLWDPMAQYIALENTVDLQNPVVRVELTRHWRQIPGPFDPPESRWHEFMFFDFQTDLRKLRQDFPRKSRF